MQVNCILTGVGGQGTVLAAQLIAGAAMRRGIPVRTAETIGMAQRGGHVVSHVRLGGAYSPLVPRASADLLIGFEPAEAVRCYPYLKQGGRRSRRGKGSKTRVRVSGRASIIPPPI